jgi:hypothetical protein
LFGVFLHKHTNIFGFYSMRKNTAILNKNNTTTPITSGK